MVASTAKVKPFYGRVPFVLEAADLSTAEEMGLLRSSVPVQQADSSKDDYGVAYTLRDNIGSEYHTTQKEIQLRCKEFAQARGFQLKVQSFSSKRQGTGNAKYVHKKLHGQTFFDTNASVDEISCPFYINVSGHDGFWKISRANFRHNHLKHVGEGTIPRLEKDMINTMQSVQQLVHLVENEMLKLNEGKTEKMTGTAIEEFLLGKGFTVSPSSISRIKRAVDGGTYVEHLVGYQKLECYLKLMAEKNPGSIWRFEKESDGTFKRACFLPSIGVPVAKNARRLYGVDGAHLKGEMNNYGVFLVATAKDYNKHILPFTFSLVLVENCENWVWFLKVVKEGLGELELFTVVSDRQKGLLSAVAEKFPKAGHRFCLRHIKGNINSKGITLTGKERRLINDMARSDCENDYKTYEKELASTKPAAVEYLKGIDKSTGSSTSSRKSSSSRHTTKPRPTLPNKQIVGLATPVVVLNR